MELFALKKKGFSDKVQVFLLVKKKLQLGERGNVPVSLMLQQKNSILHQKTVFANVISNKGILNYQTSEITVSEK